MTADELMTRLESDPEWVARRDSREAAIRARAADYDRVAYPLIGDLARAGLNVIAVSDLFNFRHDYGAAIPILLRWLPRMDNVAVKEDIVRALTDKAARPLGGPILIEEFKRLPTAPYGDPLFRLKWAIGNALSVVADDLVFDEIVKLLRDKRHGTARDQLTQALLNMKRPDHRAAAEELLVELVQDSTEGGDYRPAYAMIALSKAKPIRLKPYIERFVNHEHDWIRKEAQKALRRIEKAEEKARLKGDKTS